MVREIFTSSFPVDFSFRRSSFMFFHLLYTEKERKKRDEFFFFYFFMFSLFKFVSFG